MSDYIINYLRDCCQFNNYELEEQIKKNSAIKLMCRENQTKINICGHLGNKIIRRLYVQHESNITYSDVGWVLNEDMDCCMICADVYGMFSGRHHCRACGNLICDSCSRNSVLVHELQDLGDVRVCNQCYWGQDVVYANSRMLKSEQSQLIDHSLISLRKPKENEYVQEPKFEEVSKTPTHQLEADEVNVQNVNTNHGRGEVDILPITDKIGQDNEDIEIKDTRLTLLPSSEEEINEVPHEEVKNEGIDSGASNLEVPLDMDESQQIKHEEFSVVSIPLLVLKLRRSRQSISKMLGSLKNTFAYVNVCTIDHESREAPELRPREISGAVDVEYVSELLSDKVACFDIVVGEEIAVLLGEISRREKIFHQIIEHVNTQYSETFHVEEYDIPSTIFKNYKGSLKMKSFTRTIYL